MKLTEAERKALESNRNYSNSASSDDFKKGFEEGFDEAVAYMRRKCTTIRHRVIGQTGYGMSGCSICRSEWMRTPWMEEDSHNKDCVAYPVEL